MPKAKQIGVWFAIVGIALMVQGCWEDQRLALLGNGGCRTADDRHGDHSTLSQVSFDECQAQCFSDNGTCTAIEYTTEGGVCEIHSEPITKYAKSKGVACYIKSDLALRE